MRLYGGVLVFIFTSYEKNGLEAFLMTKKLSRGVTDEFEEKCRMVPPLIERHALA